MNQEIFYFFYNLAHKSVVFDNIIIFTATVLPWIVILLAGIFLIFHHEVIPSENPVREFFKKWKEVLGVFLTSFFAWVVAKILKTIIYVDRPFTALPGVERLFADDTFAFPSGHATFFSALAVGIFFRHKKVGYVFMFFALLIALARVIAGVHYPLDILGGFVLGALIAYYLKNV